MKNFTRPLSPTAMAKLLTAVGGEPIAAATVRAHVRDGAPTDARGRLRLIDYAAWLIDRAAGGP